MFLTVKIYFSKVFCYLWVRKCCILVGSNVESVLMFDNYNLLGEGYFCDLVLQTYHVWVGEMYKPE